MSNRKSSLELLDETFHWLRQLPAETWLIYGACAAPFYLLALRAFQELRTGGTEAIEPASLTAMAIAYLLYGFGRSEFLRRFDGEIRREPATRRGGFPALVNHILLHAAELALLPAALLSIVAFPWVVGFFRCALRKREPRLRTLVAEASQECSSLYRESSLSCLIVLAVGLAVFLNLVLAAMIVPEVVKALTGYETELTRNRLLIFNATTFAAIAGLTGLLCDTLMSGFFDVSLFYLESERSGRDLFLRLNEIGDETAA